MSMLNPGKRGILTVVALLLIVGVPGIVAYSDGSDDIYNVAADFGECSEVRLFNSGSWYAFGATSVVDGTDYTVTIDSVSLDDDDPVEFTSMTSVKYANFVFIGDYSDVSFGDFEVTIADYEPTSVSLRAYDSSESLLLSMDLVYDEDTGVYSYEPSSSDRLAMADVSEFVLRFTQSAGEFSSELSFSIESYTAETIFTDDVVELIVMVGGILLLICGTFALSFIDVDTPGKAVSYAKRGIRSAGKKMRRGKK